MQALHVTRPNRLAPDRAYCFCVWPKATPLGRSEKDQDKDRTRHKIPSGREDPESKSFLASAIERKIGAERKVERIGPREDAMKIMVHHRIPTAEAVSIMAGVKLILMSSILRGEVVSVIEETGVETDRSGDVGAETGLKEHIGKIGDQNSKDKIVVSARAVRDIEEV